MNTFNMLPKAASFYYPLGNSPPVCLTQDLPPEQDTDILLLGCGNARHILFTCFADNARKIDVTCCDIEPMIHARNVLLYTLLIEDESNHNIEYIWNILFFWKIDGNSLELLESQTQKLLLVSNSIDEWHNSFYGSCIRFCDERSLSLIRCYWLGFTSQGLSPSEKVHRQSHLQAAIDRAKADRHLMVGPDLTGYHSLFPTALYQDTEAMLDLCEVAKQWWDSGIVASSKPSALKPIHLNPAFLFSPNRSHIIDLGSSPIGSIPLCTTYISVCKESPFCLQNKNAPATERLIDCAKSHFSQWAPAFRRSVKNGSKIRIFSGDALNFCFSLRNCLLTQSTSMNLFCDGWSSEPLILHHSDYGHNKNAAPLRFDIIDTSNLSDYLGPLNLLALASSLLKDRVSSCLYTELICSYDYSLADRVSTLFGVDVRSMALLLGFVPPDLFTNATNTVEESPDACDSSRNLPGDLPGISARSRLRWKRFGGLQTSNNSSYIQVETKDLAQFLIQVHKALFKLEHLSRPSAFDVYGLKRFKRSAFEIEISKLNLHPYNRASFAFLLSTLKASIQCSDWDKCLKELYNVVLSDNNSGLIKNNFDKDLLLNLHVFGVDSSLFTKPNPVDKNSSLSSVLSNDEDVPELVCVTTRVSKDHLSILTEPSSAFYIICCFEASDSQGKRYCYSFSSVQVTFGKLRYKNEEENLYPFIEKCTETSGSSDLFVSVLVPVSMLTSMLTQSKQFVPSVKCQLRHTDEFFRMFSQALGPDLCFSSRKITSKDVFITRFMPGMSGLPVFTSASNDQDRATSNATVVRFSPDGSKIIGLIRRISLESNPAKTILANKSSVVDVKFESPLTAVISIAESLKLKLDFLVPVSISKHKVRVARRSSYVEVESGFLDPLSEEAPSFLFPCFLMKIPGGSVPVPWTSMRVDLDVMPSVDLENKEELSWVHEYMLQMFSRREFLLHFSSNVRQMLVANDVPDLRINLKSKLFTLFMFFKGFMCRKYDFFCLKAVNNDSMILILPSCLRLDLANYTIVLDCAFILLTNAMLLKDPSLSKFFEELNRKRFFTFKDRENESLAWNAMMPALVERCRTWSHTSKCEYVGAGKIPLPQALSNDGGSPICSCGMGQFPIDYLEDQMEGFSNLRHILNCYATRVAVSPIFSILYIEDCDCWDLRNENCKKCGSDKRKNAQSTEQNLFKCSKCKSVKYCSVDCQSADWKQHKPYCKAV